MTGVDEYNRDHLYSLCSDCSSKRQGDMHNIEEKLRFTHHHRGLMFEKVRVQRDRSSSYGKPVELAFPGNSENVWVRKEMVDPFKIRKCEI